MNPGFSLIEMLITLVLGLVLTLGLVQIYLQNKNHYQAAEQMARLQERGRVAVYILQQDIRSTGFIGCAKLTREFSIENHTAEESLDSLGKEGVLIKGYTAERAASEFNLPRHGRGAIVRGTDAVLVRKMAESTADLQHLVLNALHLSATPVFTAGQIVLVSDCSKADFVTVDRVFKVKQGQRLLLTETVRNYEKNAQVGAFISRLYYVAYTGRQNKQRQAIVALYSQDEWGIKTEWVEGVENMQILYGVDETGLGSVTGYYSADGVRDWHAVLSLRIRLLLNSIESVGVGATPYREAWSTYVALREQLR